MNYRNSSQLLVTFLALVSLGAPLAARTEADYLWQIGKADNNTSEFALGPDGYSKYSDDGMFIVGQSDPKKDWPYAHPAGDDVWAGGAGTHSANPPKLKVKLNDYSLEYQPPKGASDASIMGNPKAGKEHRFTLDFPAKELKKGVNKITITTASGGWILYDWIGFQAPASVRLGEPSGTLIREVRVDPWLTRIKGELSQLVWVDLTQIGDSNGLTLHLGDEKPKELELAPGNRTIELTLPPVKNQTTVRPSRPPKSRAGPPHSAGRSTGWTRSWEHPSPDGCSIQVRRCPSEWSSSARTISASSGKPDTSTSSAILPDSAICTPGQWEAC